MNDIVKIDTTLSDVKMDDDVKSYFEAMLAITPKIFKTESYSINLYNSKQQTEIRMIRFCVEYNDCIFGIQDEIYFPCENTGAQINFQVTDKLYFKRAPEKLDKHVMKFITKFGELATDKGASISVMGYGIIFESDGNGWVRKTKANAINSATQSINANSKRLGEGNKKLNA